MKKPIIIIAGPTACGKTGVSIELAKRIDGEIISADSMQVYKYMDIGTAKVTKEETQGIKHYLVDELYPDEEFNIKVFQEKALKYIDEIHSRGKIPILVGGTGFYINSVIYKNDFDETTADSDFRKKLEQTAREKGNEFVHNMLKEVDHASYESIHPNNLKRVIRALEFYNQTGKPISLHNEEEKKREEFFNAALIILNMDRKTLYGRIDERVDIMVKDGLVEEVKKLLDMGYNENMVSMKGIGYKELISYFKGECSLEYAISEIKKNTRHFAKRQVTWFKYQTDGLWIAMDGKTRESAAEEIISYLKEKDFFKNEQ
ncbi:MAG: tRNA (adenosine(37)-N6)-dimethylallyltransferase MiaA [Firmicutes bacterium]|nr:tRNA (adenosine(37)-N6)-dimethylallyltransferase MiaA [Bacillota bacterium]